MYTGLAILLLVSGLWIVRELAIGVRTFFRRTDLRFQRETEATQRHFAVARNKLMRSAVEGKIDVNSSVFKIFYAVNTALMRRPDQYEEISQALGALIILEEDEGGAKVLRSEIEELDSEALDAVEATGDAIGHLVVDYSFILRNFYRLLKRSNPELTQKKLLSELRQASFRRKKADLEKKIDRAQRDVYKLVSQGNRKGGRTLPPVAAA